MKIFLLSDSKYECREYDLQGLFESRGWDVQIVGGGDVIDFKYDTDAIIVVDADELQGMSGNDAVDGLRRAGCRNRILHTSRRDSWSDKVQALDCGADDYLAKPFLPNEILARLEAMHRRTVR